MDTHTYIWNWNGQDDVLSSVQMLSCVRLFETHGLPGAGTWPSCRLQRQVGSPGLWAQMLPEAEM